MNQKLIAVVTLVVLSTLAWQLSSRELSLAQSDKTFKNSSKKKKETIVSKISEPEKSLRKSDAEWRRLLTQEQYRVTRKKGTERAFTGEYWDNKRKGIYKCVCCGTPLFSSQTKYKSGTGWPSYWDPINKENVATEIDRGLFSVRTEVLCSKCDAHLGHVFSDGPPPTGLRYCINSVSLKFQQVKDEYPETIKQNGK